MANVTFPLREGLKVGDTIHKECEVREAGGADIIDGSMEAEQLRAAPDGWILVSSPGLAEMHITRRQVVRIGDHKGPLTLAEMKLLSAFDLNLIRAAAASFDTATQEVGPRGRDDGAAGDD
jgi:phage FluMu protein gp41